MNKFTKLALATTLALSSTAVLAKGEGGFDFADRQQLDLPAGWTAKVGATTDAVFRGVSISDQDAAFGANVNYLNQSGWYAGASIFSADGVDYANTLYLGTTFEFLAQPNLPAYIQAKHYNLQDAGADFDFNEFELGISEKFQDAEIGISVAYSPDYFNFLDDATYLSGYAEYNDVDLPLGAYTQDWTIGVQLGRSENDLDDYTDLKVYFGKQYDTGSLKGLGIELAYHDTDSLVVLPTGITDDRFVASVSYSF